MIKHHNRPAAGSQYTMDLTHGPGCVGRVMQDTVRVDHIETVIRKIEVLGICLKERSRQIEQLKSAASEINCRFC